MKQASQHPVMRWLVLLAFAATAVVGCARYASPPDAYPAPTPGALLGAMEEEDPLREQREREEWLDRTHVTPDGTPWRDVEARTREQLAPQRVAAARALRSGGRAKANVAAAIGGRWTERGSTNIAGRVIAAAYDADGDAYFAYAHGGTIWRRPRTSNDWQVLNDAQTFPPDYLAGSLELVRGPGRPLRLLVGAKRVSYSDDGGASWADATGFSGTSEVDQLVVRNDGSGEVYVTRSEVEGSAYRSRLYASNDGGARFAPVAWLGEGRPGLLALPAPATAVYLLDRTTLYRVEPRTHARVALGTLPTDNGEFAQWMLAGGVAPDGRAFLYAAYGCSYPNSCVYRSLDGGITWETRTSVPSAPFTRNSLGASARDPNLLVFGEVNANLTTDGAASWGVVNYWWEYYRDPATKLHADITSVRAYAAPDGSDRLLISTDGGLFDVSDGGRTVNNLSLEGLRNSQYYAAYTSPDSGTILAGSQDQGYQKSVGGSTRFVQEISGDYGPIVSGDRGRTAWTSYPRFVLHDADVSRPNSRQDTWTFEINGFPGYSWLSHFSLPGDDPNRVWVSGTRSETGYHIVELIWSPVTGISGVALPFDFGGSVTATARDPFDDDVHYATTYEFAAQRLFRSNDRGMSWQALGGGVPPPSNYYAQIRPDPTREGRIYLSGSNYDGRGVLVSEDRGASTRPIVDGLPLTYVYDVAVAGDTLFAATEAGAFRYDRATNRWTDITLGAPSQAYWSVQLLEGSQTARFATYGRGIWDFSWGEASPEVPLQAGLTGFWYETAKPGQGLDIEVFDNGTLFSTWYTYDAGNAGGSERQRWYSLQGSFAPGATRSTLTIYRNEGGNFDAPPATTAQAVGTATLTASSCASTTLAYSFADGRSGTLQLARLMPDLRCSATGTSLPLPASERNALWSGHWYRPETSGQGFGVELNPRAGALFMAWFTYVPDGSGAGGGASQRWYSIQTSAAPAQSTFANAPIFETTGGVFDSDTTVTTRRVGTATVTLGCRAAAVDYVFDGGSSAGRAGRIELVRIGAVPAACEGP